ncbi:uncharacterized protein CLUP02_11114 [Colletotrichum lupini]|uniref:Uncharacterized protein n=1 Tax=Colletotrichum lupini TaxID=145971 RepID=A0A9Q8SYU0_9PEZI|nr:uncharacterized protein CLUP02_11114 [Colletotrichum lupini]UQC85615.1 hypothetical protein CLUP02_11114 [Colletotrichum lupini]
MDVPINGRWSSFGRGLNGELEIVRKRFSVSHLPYQLSQLAPVFPITLQRKHSTARIPLHHCKMTGWLSHSGCELLVIYQVDRNPEVPCFWVENVPWNATNCYVSKSSVCKISPPKRPNLMFRVLHCFWFNEGFFLRQTKGTAWAWDESSERMVERHWNTDTKSDGSELRGPKEAVFRQRFGCCRFRVPADCGPPIRALSALSLFNQTLNNDSKSGVALFHMGKRRAHSSRLQPESKRELMPVAEKDTAGDGLAREFRRYCYPAPHPATAWQQLARSSPTSCIFQKLQQRVEKMRRQEIVVQWSRSAGSVTPRSALDQYRQYRPASNRYPSATTVQPGQTQQISIVPFRGFHSRLYLTSSCFNYPYLRYWTTCRHLQSQTRSLSFSSIAFQHYRIPAASIPPTPESPTDPFCVFPPLSSCRRTNLFHQRHHLALSFSWASFAYGELIVAVPWTWGENHLDSPPACIPDYEHNHHDHDRLVEYLTSTLRNPTKHHRLSGKPLRRLSTLHSLLPTAVYSKYSLDAHFSQRDCEYIASFVARNVWNIPDHRNHPLLSSLDVS